MPVLRAKEFLAPEMPSMRFHEKENPYFLPILTKVRKSMKNWRKRGEGRYSGIGLGLYVEAEMHDIPIAHNIFFAFHTHFAGFFYRHF